MLLFRLSTEFTCWLFFLNRAPFSDFPWLWFSFKIFPEKKCSAYLEIMNWSIFLFTNFPIYKIEFSLKNLNVHLFIFTNIIVMNSLDSDYPSILFFSALSFKKRTRTIWLVQVLYSKLFIFLKKIVFVFFQGC